MAFGKSKGPRKYDYSKVEKISGREYKYSMVAIALYVLIHFEYIDIGGGIFWIITTTLLGSYIWWSFRSYFIRVGDNGTAKWLSAVIIMFLLIGASSLLIQATTNIFDYVPSVFINLAYLMLIICGLSLAIFIFVCIRVISVNRHHTFPLKRIALASVISIPIYVLFILLSNIQFVGQLADVSREMSAFAEDFNDAMDPTGGYVAPAHLQMVDAREFLFPDFGGLFSGIFSFFKTVWTFIVMLPYFFLFFHFFKADKANA